VRASVREETVREENKKKKDRKSADRQIRKKRERSTALPLDPLIYVLPKAAENEGIRVLTG